jgi:hypothetical protein
MADQIKLGKTVKTAVAEAVAAVAANPMVPGITPAEATKTATAVLTELAQDPKFINATNSERWYQSGVAMGLNGVSAGALAIVLPMLIAHGLKFAEWDWAIAGPAIFIIASAAYGYVRRFVPGLPPLFSGK